MDTLNFKTLTVEYLDDICKLTQHLNPDLSPSLLKERQKEMFCLPTYTCFGLFENKQLIGICSAWTTVRLYSGKQIEIDNVIINPNLQSKGYGSQFLAYIESWVKEKNCLTIELNTYVQNSRSHKFYYNHGYKVLGFHFQKNL